MRISTRDLLAGHWPLLLTGFLLTFFSGFGQTVFIGAHIPFIEETFGLSHTRLSLFYGCATLLSGVVLFFSGKLLDHMALHRFIVMVLGGLAAGAFLLAYAPSALFLFPAFFLLRQCGQGLMTLTNTVSMNRYLEESRGRAMAFTNVGLSLTTLFPIIGMMVIGAYGWQDAWAYYGLFILCGLLPLFYGLFRHHDRTIHAAWKDAMERSLTFPDDNPIRQWTRAEVLKDWRFYILISVFFIGPCFNTGLFYYQAELAASKGQEPLIIASAFPLFTLASVVSMYLAGHFLDRFGEKYVLMAYPLLYIGGMVLFIVLPGLISLYSGMIVLGMSMGTMAVLGGPILAKLYGTLNLGSIKSTLGSVNIISSSIGPVIVGFCLDQSYAMASILTGFVVYAFLAWLIMVCCFTNKIEA